MFGLETESSSKSVSIYDSRRKLAAERTKKAQEEADNTDKTQTSAPKTNFVNPYESMIEARLANAYGYGYATTPGTATSIGSGFSNKYDSKILQYANKYNIDPNLVKAIIMTETGFNEKVTSSCDCQGLMQVNSHYNSGNLYNVDNNLDAGCKIFRHALDTFDGDINKAIMAYNMGEANVKKGKLNQKYLKKVLGYYNQLKNGSQYTITSGKKIDVNA